MTDLLKRPWTCGLESGKAAIRNSEGGLIGHQKGDINLMIHIVECVNKCFEMEEGAES